MPFIKDVTFIVLGLHDDVKSISKTSAAQKLSCVADLTRHVSGSVDYKLLFKTFGSVVVPAIFDRVEFFVQTANTANKANPLVKVGEVFANGHVTLQYDDIQRRLQLKQANASVYLNIHLKLIIEEEKNCNDNKEVPIDEVSNNYCLPS